MKQCHDSGNGVIQSVLSHWGLQFNIIYWNYVCRLLWYLGHIFENYCDIWGTFRKYRDKCSRQTQTDYAKSQKSVKTFENVKKHHKCTSNVKKCWGVTSKHIKNAPKTSKNIKNKNKIVTCQMANNVKFVQIVKRNAIRKHPKCKKRVENIKTHQKVS